MLPGSGNYAWYFLPVMFTSRGATMPGALQCRSGLFNPGGCNVATATATTGIATATATATAVATATVIANATATARTAEFYNWILI